MPDTYRKATDADYDASSREIIGKVDIYLMGSAAAPVEVLYSDGLISYSVIEEASADSDKPFGNVTANEITITLYNDNGIYNPTNQSSPYFGRMKRGVQVIPYLRTAETEYEPVGTFYVNDWKATITGTTATITAADKLYDVFDTPLPNIPVVRNTTFNNFIVQIFRALNVGVTIDSNLDWPLAMSYANKDVQPLLTDVSIGALAMCGCDHKGDIRFKSLVAPREVRAILTDTNQIIDVDAELNLTTSYNGASVTYHIPQESADTSVLSANDIVVQAGVSTLPKMSLSTSPLIRLLSARIISTKDIDITDINADTNSVVLVVNNRSNEIANASIEVTGVTVETIEGKIGSTDTNVIEVNNDYIQSPEYAAQYLEMLERFVGNTTPVLRISTRGNPLLNVLDKVQVKSEKYNLDFTGIIMRNEISYTGALHSTLTLLNAEILEV